VTVVPHPSHSPDLTPCDFPVFPTIVTQFRWSRQNCRWCWIPTQNTTSKMHLKSGISPGNGAYAQNGKDLLWGWWWPVGPKLVFDQMAALVQELKDSSGKLCRMYLSVRTKNSCQFSWFVEFAVLTVVVMNVAVLWDIAPCRPDVNCLNIWKLRWYVPLKYQFTYELRDTMSQKMATFSSINFLLRRMFSIMNVKDWHFIFN
jgi:hypothetical protein